MRVFRRLPVVLVSLLLFVLPGCKSRDEKALEQAKVQAAATGQAQQIVSVDKDGRTTTTVVQPSQSGQAALTVTTTTTTPAVVGPMGVAVGTPALAGAAGEAAPAAVQSLRGQPSGLQPVGQVQTAAAVPGGGPVMQAMDVRVAAGTNLTIRINQHISVKTSRAGERFTGEVAEPVADESGRVLAPRGTAVGGVIDAAHRRGHFKGRSLLELRLTSMTLNGQEYALETRDLTRSKKGKGKRSAAFIGGGTGLGMLVGGVATGGVGLLVGGLAGGGAGTAVAGLTGNRDIEIPAESIMQFKLAQDLVVQGR